MPQSVALVAIMLLAVDAHCYPVGVGPEKSEKRPAQMVNGYIESLHKCLSLHTPLECCGLEECNIRGMVGGGKPT